VIDDAIEPGIERLGLKSQVLMEYSEQMATLANKLQELKEDLDLSLRQVGRKRPRPDK
jgi:hypothetical protein